MLTFTEDYFATEVRDGFAVNELMKRNWAAQLKLLDMVIGICEKYDLTYYAYAGTLIGTVRHKGYVPWDDDLDIAMKRDDYIKFLEVAEKELPAECAVLNCYTEDDCTEVFTRLTNGQALDFSKERLDRYYGCPFAVGLDVFPLYYIPRDEESAEGQKAILQYISTLSAVILEEYGNQTAVLDAEIKEALQELEELTGFSFTTDRPLGTQLAVLYDQVSRLYTEEESDLLTVFGVYMKTGCVMEKEQFAEVIKLPFENLLINAPKEYDAILRKSYGDYMTPIRAKSWHDYPYYKGQLVLLGEHIDRLDCQWKTEQLAIAGSVELAADEKTGVLLPEEWQEKLYTDDGKRKRVLLYHTSAASLLCNGENVLEKLRHTFALMKESKDVVLWWFPSFLDNPRAQFVKEMSPGLVQDYHQLLEEYRRENWGILDASGDRQRAVAMADAYYGDEGELLQMFVETGRSAMLQEYTIIK